MKSGIPSLVIWLVIFVVLSTTIVWVPMSIVGDIIELVCKVMTVCES